MTLVLQTGTAAASTSKVLYKFKGSPDGANPSASLIFDATGNLYGITTVGGTSYAGTVFKLTPNSNGSWRESVLYSFCSLRNCADGGNPNLTDVGLTGAGLIFDAAGNLYGTTTQGGSGSGCPSDVNGGCGVVFKLTPNANGTWTESVLYSFCPLTNCADGENPAAGLIFDTAGNLYGTTPGGGHLGCGDIWPGCGVVFKLTPNANGSWTESVLYKFCSLTSCADGAAPFAGLIFDGAGNLYGTTVAGGFNNGGTAFKLKPHTDGSWTESLLYRENNGLIPEAGLIFDAAGNLYGTTTQGGINGYDGVVFKLKPNSNGSWTYSVVHYFHSAFNPTAGLIFDASSGSLYGTVLHGGPAGGGAVFKLAPMADGGWAYSVLRFFFGEPAMNPFGGLVLDKAGNLYGTTLNCGTGYNCQGVVFEITP
jgi:hypothetical protein